MRKIFLGLLALAGFANQNLFAQKMASDYFDEGQKYFESEDYKSALASFQYIVKHYSKSDLYPKAFYNTGYIYFMDKQYDSSVVVFKSILIGNFNEKENSGGDIMADPYSNYRHRASELISSIYYNKKMYDTALFYFTISDTVYPYLHFCGNEFAENDIYTALRYADLYQKLNRNDIAIESLLPAVFITLADNSEVLSQLKTLLEKKKDLKKDLDLALSNMYSKPLRQKDAGYKRYFFRFLNAEITVPGGYEDEKKKFDKDKAISEIEESSFYKMIIAI